MPRVGLTSSAIVRTAYRYKRPPRERKPVVIEGPAIVKGKSSRRPADSQGAAEVISLEPRLRDGATESTTAVEAPRDRPVTGGGKLKSSIVTVRRPGRRFADVPDMTPEEHKQRGEAADAL